MNKTTPITTIKAGDLADILAHKLSVRSDILNGDTDEEDQQNVTFVEGELYEILWEFMGGDSHAPQGQTLKVTLWFSED